MKLFEVLNRWIDRRRQSEQNGQNPIHPSRLHVLRQPDGGEELQTQARQRLAASENARRAQETDAGARDQVRGRYRAKPSWEGGGPQWDPYAKDQSRAAQVQSRRRARPRSQGPIAHDRWHGSGVKAPRVTHYQVLGVQPHASVEQIERAYRRYASAIHPDKFFDDP
jgi:DnaJ-domain-containing protein 1